MSAFLKNVDGEVYAVEVDGHIYGIAGADGLAERARTTAEADRIAAETARVQAEILRGSAEKERVTAESARAAAQAKNNADQALNNERMMKLQPHVCVVGEYDAKTRIPTITKPNDAQLYLVPLSDSGAPGSDGDAYAEWRYVAKRWERLGVSNVDVSRITTDDIDRVSGGTAVGGESILNLTGLKYLWTKISAAIERVDTAHKTLHSALIASLSKKSDVDHTHDTATSRADGFMSSYDKRKLDDIDANANNYTLPQASAYTKGGVYLSDSPDKSKGPYSGYALTPSALASAMTPSSWTTIWSQGQWFIKCRKLGKLVELAWAFNQENGNNWQLSDSERIPYDMRPDVNISGITVATDWYANSLSDLRACYYIDTDGRMSFRIHNSRGGVCNRGHCTWIAGR
ncbi:hypothetical protein K6V98_00130 [Collinsella sp. AGMB00827]|uniref:Uncharacterized protein n=1 Tax=Collinsella ureilytica TaxID=2869515 RepID=A0ABS7MHR4_9ACTN|nr:hypothetical protein [Collinsella urealyticum]MBY4796777.1 hypothetical protein [Collinsella urealyticum]